MNRTKERTKREKVLVTLPDNYLTALDNKIDNILIRTRGDAVISLLTELQKANPNALEFEEMIYIKSSEYLQLKNELNSIKISQSKSSVRPWMTEKIIDALEAALELKGRTENTALIALEEIKTSKALADKFHTLKQENSDLKKKLAELQPAGL